MSAEMFAAQNPDLVAKLEAAGIDWKTILGKLMAALGPIILQILADLLKPAPAPTPGPTT
jgi:hypothetical protein